MATRFFKVDLDGRAYTYKSDFDVSVGDRVVVPPNRIKSEPQVAPVIRLLNKPDYDVDKIVSILAKVGNDPLADLEAMLEGDD